MPNDRFYTPDALKGQEIIVLKEEEHRHLHVMRVKKGDSLEMVNGKGYLATGKLESMTKKESHILIESVEFTPPSPIKLKLAIGLPRFNRLEYLVEKAVEIGIDSFLFFPALGSEKETLSSNQWERLEHLAISALKQCGRLYLPTFTLMPKLCLWEKREETLFFGDVSQAPHILDTLSPKNEILFFIGPEKGFHEEELSFLKEELQAKGVSLGPHTLRVDTAAIVAAAFLSKALI